MKFQKINIVLALAGSLTLLGACKKFGDFGDTNVSPNGALVPVTSAVLTNGINDIANLSGREFQTNPMLYVQWFSQTQYPDESQYSLAAGNWNTLYVQSLEDFQKIIDVNSDPKTKAFAANSGSNANQIAVAKILKSYTFALLTDCWGDAPYTEALSGKTETNYDSQETIYKGIIKDLKDAVAQFDGGTAMKGDILLNGKIDKWKKFANSLRMIYSLRLSKRYPTASEYAATEFKAALADPAGYISANADNVFFSYLDDNNFRNQFNALYDGRDDYAMSDVFVNKLKDINDPRLTVFAKPLADGSYKGLPYGLKRDLLLAYEAANPEWSRLGDGLRTKTSKGYIVTAAQVSLARAEAAQRGWTSEVALTLYNDAIQKSWEQNAVFDAAKYAAYIADAKTAFATDPLTQIGVQRWIALFPNQGFEAWSEWRRTNVPALTPSAYSVNESKQIPRRYLYPATEININNKGFSAAITRQGPDKDNTRVWWDKP